MLRFDKDEVLERAANANEWSDATIKAFMAKVERIRIMNNLPTLSFGEYLGLDKTYAYRTFLYNRCKPSLQMFLNFCYIFGYDVDGIRSNAPDTPEIEKSTYELACILSSLSPESLEKIANFTTEGIEDDSNIKWRLNNALKTMANTIRELDSEADTTVDASNEP